MLFRAKAPQIHQRPDGNIHRTIGLRANAQRGSDDFGHRFTYWPRRQTLRVVKAHQRGIFFIGRKQLIVGVQLGLNLFFKFGTAFGINARDAGTPEGTHGFAFKNGNFSSVGFGGLWFLIATNKEERGSQQCHAGKAYFHT